MKQRPRRPCGLRGLDAGSALDWLYHPSFGLGEVLLGVTLVVLAPPLTLLCQAAALRLLDQPPRPRDLLDPGPVVERLGSPDPALRDAALWALRRHPDWSGAALDHLRGRLRAAPRPDEAPLTDLVLAFQGRADVQALLAEVATDASAPAGRRAWALETMARSRLAPLPGPWVGALAASLSTGRRRTARVMQSPTAGPGFRSSATGRPVRRYHGPERTFQTTIRTRASGGRNAWG